MSNEYFIIRNKCPACLSKKHELLYRKSYDDSTVREYLKFFYGDISVSKIGY